jgi:hypothetical protein
VRHNLVTYSPFQAVPGPAMATLHLRVIGFSFGSDEHILVPRTRSFSDRLDASNRRANSWALLDARWWVSTRGYIVRPTSFSCKTMSVSIVCTLPRVRSSKASPNTHAVHAFQAALGRPASENCIVPTRVKMHAVYPACPSQDRGAHVGLSPVKVPNLQALYCLPDVFIAVGPCVNARLAILVSVSR